MDACTTRLRLEVVDDALVNEPALRSLGARGMVRPGRNVLQVVIGPQAEILAGEIREAMAGGQYDALAPAAVTPAVAAEPGPRSISDQPVGAGAEDTEIAQRLVRAFGGPGNVQKAEHVAVTRLRWCFATRARPMKKQCKSAGAGSVIKASDNVWHVIAGERAAAIAAAVKLNLNAPSGTATPVA